MKSDITKSIIRIIQDYCFENSATIICDKFAMTMAPQVLILLKNQNLELSNFYSAAKVRRDFFVANNLKLGQFCKGLLKRLNFEISFCKQELFYDSIIRFKMKMEDGIFKGFIENKTSEDELRRALALFISEETFLEPEMSGGKSDICIPSEKTIIEIKLWNGLEYYMSGFPELEAYLNGRGYNEGYYIIFDYNKSDNEVIKKKGQIFDERYREKLFHIFFIKMNPVAPSKKYKEAKKS